MITITNDSIILPQGETAIVSFGFKDVKNNSPLLLSNPNVIHAINVVIKDQISNTGDAILAKSIIIENNTYGTGWHIFENSELQYIELEGDNMSPGDSETTIADRIDKYETLYKIVCKDSKNAIKWTVYKYKDNDGTLRDYDYDDSSITILFARNDTKSLQPKTYYLEIYHEIKEPDLEPIKHTLLAPINFIVKGALA